MADSEWEVFRRQVAIWGRVSDVGDEPIAGVRVSLAEAPEAFASRLRGAMSAAGKRWQEMDERVDRVLTRHDGLYYFLDLPAGSYTLAAVAPRSGARSEKRVAVACDKEGNVKAAVADFRLKVE